MRKLLLMCILPAILCTFAHAKIIYVDDDAAGTNDGSSWQNAYNYLQDALADANSSEKPVEIHVAQGIYKPDQGAEQTSGYKYTSFQLIDDVTVSGGYAGIFETDPNERNVAKYQTMLSGDLGGDDIEVEDPCDLLKGIRGENSAHVVSSVKNDANAVLDGVTISGGSNRIDVGSSRGGGIDIFRGNPTIVNCTLTYNAARYGGGMTITAGSPTIINCMFTKNYSFYGAGICNGCAREPGNPMFRNCVFSNNFATTDGGGMYNFGPTSKINFTSIGSVCVGGNVELENCMFIKNIASIGGGITSNENLTLNNCVFTNNSAMIEGGALATDSYDQLLAMNNCIFTGNRAFGTQSSLGSGGACSLSIDNTTINNCTFYGNWANQNSSIAKNSSSIINISNCIIWDGQDSISDSNSSTLKVSYSDIQGGLEGDGNIDTDPLFANPGYWADANDPNIIVEPNNPNSVWVEGDYHLKSQAGRWDINTQSWIQDDVTSPCIDAGDPNSPVSFESFPNGMIINMGAYGGTAEASKSPSGLHAKYGGGKGEQNNPYLIYTPEHINTIGLYADDWDKHFKLMADIDMSAYQGTSYNIIGTAYYDFSKGYAALVEVPFKGVFDGDNHTISNLCYEWYEANRTGLFGYIYDFNAEITNLILIDPNINAGVGDEVGAIAGFLERGTISNCHVVSGKISGDGDIGGLVGLNGGTISGSSSSADISGHSSVGGLIGRSFGNIYKCCSSGSVQAYQRVGGLVGYFDTSKSTIENCYATGNVSGDNQIGGLIGWNYNGTILNCYAAGNVAGTGQTNIGGLIGDNYDGLVQSSFWDTETSGQITSAAGIGLTTSQMQTKNTFTDAGWDFDEVWDIAENQTYPFLRR